MGINVGRYVKLNPNIGDIDRKMTYPLCCGIECSKWHVNWYVRDI